jgi:acyl carrier protein
MKQEILDRLNEIIIEEKGSPVTINSTWMEADLDSLGTLITVATLESEYPFIAPDKGLDSIDWPNFTIRELVKLCVLSITPTLPEPT